MSNSPRALPLPFSALVVFLLAFGYSAALEVAPNAIKGANKKNVLLILSDDHRYDAMAFMNHPFLETPHGELHSRLNEASGMFPPLTQGDLASDFPDHLGVDQPVNRNAN